MGVRKQGERGPSRFRMLEVTRAMIAARNAGVEVPRMTIEANGRITWKWAGRMSRAPGMSRSRTAGQNGDLDQAEEGSAA